MSNILNCIQKVFRSSFYSKSLWLLHLLWNFVNEFFFMAGFILYLTSFLFSIIEKAWVAKTLFWRCLGILQTLKSWLKNWSIEQICYKPDTNKQNNSTSTNSHDTKLYASVDTISAANKTNSQKLPIKR